MPRVISVSLPSMEGQKKLIPEFSNSFILYFCNKENNHKPFSHIYRGMGVILIDGSTVRNFVADETNFNKNVDERFASLDLNNDGILSRSELRKACESMKAHLGVGPTTTQEELGRLYDSIFENFDCDKNGSIDIDEFRSEMKKILLAIADGLGSSPIQMVLEEGEENLLKQAADRETKIQNSASSS